MFYLAENGAAACVVRLCDRPIPSERYAAEELRRFVREISGASLPIGCGEHEILVGYDSYAAALFPEEDIASLGAEGFVLRSRGGRLLIAGGRPRGTLYGVYTLLEKHLGCRFYTPEVSHIPKCGTLRLDAVNERKVPLLEYREVFYHAAFDMDWAARSFVNGHHQKLDETHGGGVVFYPFVHTFDRLVPQSVYFKTHPEYYSEVDGARKRGDTQLCLTNPEVLEIAVESARTWVRAHPEATIFSISQNDGFEYCRCEKCRAVDEYEGSSSGTLIRFVNAVTERLTAEFPDIVVETLAYQYSRIPPKHVRPLSNVIVRLCSIECCFSHPLEQCAARRPPHPTEYVLPTTFREDLEGWSRIHNRLYVWDYVVNFKNYLLPYPNFHVLQQNIRFFIRNNVRGIFEQGCGDMPGSEFAELRAFLLARLLWDADADTDALMNEFLAVFYGPSAEPVRAYIDLFRDHVLDSGIHIHMACTANRTHFPGEVLDRAETLLAEAERLAGDGEIRSRVRRLALSLKYVRLCHIPKNSRMKRAAAEAFYAEAAALGVPSSREGWDAARCIDYITDHGMMQVWDDIVED